MHLAQVGSLLPGNSVMKPNVILKDRYVTVCRPTFVETVAPNPYSLMRPLYMSLYLLDTQTHTRKRQPRLLPLGYGDGGVVGPLLLAAHGAAGVVCS